VGEKKHPDLVQSWVPAREGDYEQFPPIPSTQDKVLDAIAQSAFSSLRTYGNCCRTVLWAIQVHLRREEPATLRAASVLAGGICGSGKTCGTVLGGLIAIGQSLGSFDFGDLETYSDANAAAGRFVKLVTERYGSTDCFDIQTSIMGWSCDDPSKGEEWMRAGGSEACAGVCARVARIAAGVILEAEADVQEPSGAEV